MVDSPFRAMEPDEDDGPKVGTARNMLGVRLGELDKRSPRDANGMVLAGPGRGGPSVNVNDWRKMPAPIKPKAFGGHNSLNVLFIALASRLEPARLALGEVHPTTRHACVEAADECPISEFQARIASTRPAWSQAPPPRTLLGSGALQARTGT